MTSNDHSHVIDIARTETSLRHEDPAASYPACRFRPNGPECNRESPNPAFLHHYRFQRRAGCSSLPWCLVRKAVGRKCPRLERNSGGSYRPRAVIAMTAPPVPDCVEPIVRQARPFVPIVYVPVIIRAIGLIATAIGRGQEEQFRGAEFQDQCRRPLAK
jgi:hypothetical protein